MTRMQSALAVLLLATLACSPGVVEPTRTPEVEGPPPEQPPTATEVSPISAPPTEVGLSLRAEGNAEYLVQAQAALDLLGACAPAALATVDHYIDVVLQSERSGMLADEKTFLASDTTAFAPGYQPAAQVFWFAGSIVHDARHGYQKEIGQTISWDTLTLPEREAIEDDARGVQIEVLNACVQMVEPEAARSQAQSMLDYLQDMQDGTIPCDYCEIEWANRDW